MISQDALAQRLNVPFRYYESVDSTNDIAQQWIRDGASALSVVIADEQLRGRGRKGRFWHTPPNVALAMSIALRVTPQYAHRVSMIGALTVYDLCDNLNIDNVGIKWPNDVQIDSKKVSGILPEAVWEGEKLLGVVLGMGVNVRVDFHDDIRNIAINLEDAAGQPLNRLDLIAFTMQRVAHWYQRIASYDLVSTWRSRLNTIGNHVRVDEVRGVAQSVDDSGALLIKTADGSIQRVLAGDVSLIPPANE